ncbi:MAG: hypothetical protein R2860_13950 [Desulfobacterales bacterium]
MFGEHGFGPAAVDHIQTHTGLFNDFYINFDRILLSEASHWFGGTTRKRFFGRLLKKH